MSQFIDRLLNRAVANAEKTNVKPQLTPEMISETFSAAQNSQDVVHRPRRPLSANNDSSHDLSQNQVETSSTNLTQQQTPILTAVPLYSNREMPTQTASTIPNNLSNVKQIEDTQQANTEKGGIKSAPENTNHSPLPPKNPEERNYGSKENLIEESVQNENKSIIPQKTEAKETINAKQTALQLVKEKPEILGPVNEQIKKSVKNFSEGVKKAVVAKDSESSRFQFPKTFGEVQVSPVISQKSATALTGNPFGRSKDGRMAGKSENLEPTVTISIGKIEVRAIMPEKEPVREIKPVLSLEDYLKRRREGIL